MQKAGTFAAEASSGVSRPAGSTALALALSLGLHGVVGASAVWLHFDAAAINRQAPTLEVAFWPAAEAAAVGQGAPQPETSASPPAVAVADLPPPTPPAEPAPLAPNAATAPDETLPPLPREEEALSSFKPAPAPKSRPREVAVRPAAAKPQPPPPAELTSPAPVVRPGDQLAAASNDARTAAPSAAAQEAAVPAATAAASASDLPLAPPVVTQARFRSPPAPPSYPRRAIDLGQEGEVIIRALVGPDGESREIRIFRSSGIGLLDDAALRAVRRWAFEAAQMNGRAVEAWVEVPVRFHLRSVL